MLITGASNEAFPLYPRLFRQNMAKCFAVEDYKYVVTSSVIIPKEGNWMASSSLITHKINPVINDAVTAPKENLSLP